MAMGEWWEISAASALQSCWFWLGSSITMRRVWGAGHGLAMWRVKQPNLGTLFNRVAQITECGDFILNRLLYEKGFFRKKDKEWRKIQRKLLALLDEIDQENIQGLSNGELSSTYERFCDVNTEFWDVGMVIEPLYFSLDPALREKISEKLKQKGEQKKFAQILAALTTPSKPTFLSKAEEEFCAIATEAAKRPELASMISEKGSAKSLLEQDVWFAKKMGQYAKKWFWIQNGYEKTRRLAAEDFAKKMCGEWPACANQPRPLEDIKANRRKAMRELGPDAELEKLVELANYFAVFQDDRKELMMRMTGTLDALLAEAGRRMCVPFEMMQHTVPAEVLAGLEGKPPAKKVLDERMAYSLSVATDGGMEVFGGREAERKLAEIVGTQAPLSEIEEVRGTCASPGRAIGTVKVVVNIKDGGKFGDNDVLVTSMTQPDYVPLMKRASAVVTDIGGVTCHAAIISRELGKPCIIGTKIATKVFKDGDLVEVKADHGVIRKIKVEEARAPRPDVTERQEDAKGR